MLSERREAVFLQPRKRNNKAIIILSILLLATFFFLDKNLKVVKTNSRVKRNEEETEVEVDNGCENGGIWHEKLQRCSCTLGWIGIRCNIWHNHHCYFDNGLNYRGKLSRTREGKVCKPWTTEHNSRFELGKQGIGIHNSCRNPDNDEEGLWCYVGGEDFIGYCNASRCPDSVRAVLSINTTDIGPEDDTSAAVQFLFGPLISGVCVGVVALLAFIAIAEYLRRKRYLARKREEKKHIEVEKGEHVSTNEKEEKKTNEKSEYSDKNSEERIGIRTLGGIITVDVDTGKEKCRTFSAKDMDKIPNAVLEANLFGQNNSAFVREESKEFRRISVDTLEMGPPPPYEGTQTIEDECIFDDDTIVRDDFRSRVEEKRPMRTTRSKGQQKRRNRSRSESSKTSKESCQIVLEENLDTEHKKSIKPVPKPRSSKKTSRRFDEFSDTREQVGHPKEVKRENERNVVESALKINEELPISLESQSKRKTGERKRRQASRDNVTKLEKNVHIPTEKKPHGKQRKNREKHMKHKKLHDGDISRKRKSVKEMTKRFQRDERSMPVLSSDTECVSVTDKYEIMNEVPINKTVINSKDEPTTFL